MVSRPDIAEEVKTLNQERFAPSKQLQPQWEYMRAILCAFCLTDGILVQG